MFVPLCVQLLVFIHSATCANILGVFPAPGYSQFILGEALMTELAKRNHNVTVISPYMPKIKFTNYKTIYVNESLSLYDKMDFFVTGSRHFTTSIMGTQKSGLLITESTLSNSDVQELIHSHTSFDLVIVEQFFCEALMGFAKYYEAPLVVFSSIGASEWNNHLMSNPNLPSYMRITKLSYTTQMSLKQRVKNTVVFVFDALYKRYVTYPKQDQLLKKYFPKSMNLEEVIYDASIMLLNSHYSITDPFPLVPGMVEVGGFHISSKRLSKDLQAFLDGAAEGAIYFSMGTNLKVQNLKLDILQNIITALSKLKQRVLWKCEASIPNLPSNVLVSKWLPQNDILSHRNVKLFISHGGLLSTTEAVHSGVPMIIIPIFGDQKMNAAKAEKFGFSLNIPYEALSGNTLYEAIETVLKNPKYKENVLTRSQLYHDRVMKPLNLTMYWIEHVLKYRQGTHLRFAGADLQWYQLYLLDILGLVGIAVFVVFMISKILLRVLQRGKKLKQL